MLLEYTVMRGLLNKLSCYWTRLVPVPTLLGGVTCGLFFLGYVHSRIIIPVKPCPTLDTSGESGARVVNYSFPALVAGLARILWVDSSRADTFS